MLLYKTLCDVKWLHEYYLTRDTGETIFESPAQIDRLNFLLDRFTKVLPSIDEDLEFLEHPLNQTFKNHHIRILPSYSGFRLAVECKKKKLGSGVEVYTPVIPLPDQLCLRILIRYKNDIRRFSAETSPKPLNALWYFSNHDKPFVRTFPFLSAPVPAFVPAQQYVQSEIAMHAATVKSFLNNGAPNPWLTLPGKHYVNTNDTHLLPLSFVYTFSAFENITTATFTLKDAANAVVKTIAMNAVTPMQNVVVSFRTNEELVKAVRHDAVSDDQFYKLEVTGNGGYAKTFTNLLFAHDELEAEKYAGVIDLVVKPTVSNFRLQDGNGHLFTRISAAGIRQPAPVFELWMKSKSAFWQYINNRQRAFKLTVATQDLLADNGGVLRSKNPVPMSYTPVKLKKSDGTFQLLPNPDPSMAVKREGNTVLLNMQVPTSNLFPLL